MTRVPFIIKGTGITTKSENCNHLIEAIDVLPTLLDLAGIQSPANLNGRSFANLFNDCPYQPRQSALTEFAGWKTLRTSHHRYLLHEDGQEMLWDINKASGSLDLTDPAHQLILTEIRHIILQRMLEMERLLPRFWPY